MALILDLFDQQTDVALLAIRIVIGTVFLVHAVQKLQMWSMKPSEQMSQGQLNLFKFLGVVEALGAVSVFFGFLTQLSSLGLAIIMIGAIIAKRTQFKLGFSERQATGWEFDLVLFGVTIALFLVGAGQFSIDSLLF